MSAPDRKILWYVIACLIISLGCIAYVGTDIFPAWASVYARPLWEIWAN